MKFKLNGLKFVVSENQVVNLEGIEVEYAQEEFLGMLNNTKELLAIVKDGVKEVLPLFAELDARQTKLRHEIDAELERLRHQNCIDKINAEAEAEGKKQENWRERQGGK